ncbi:uncharacterized protein LOC119710614 isoform X2 [Motacilla alba alba]|uniref:uncharacterized protein LOC119710614 isoform X2 n=1 Tax=Motacilla alba alba TaxID=1094192 RepID=UPI0018D4EDFC|nr:uncharacterized protein LOC119710614 isoform X2 [Motacilla alba alba]
MLEIQGRFSKQDEPPRVAHSNPSLHGRQESSAHLGGEIFLDLSPKIGSALYLPTLKSWEVFPNGMSPHESHFQALIPWNSQEPLPPAELVNQPRMQPTLIIFSRGCCGVCAQESDHEIPGSGAFPALRHPEQLSRAGVRHQKHPSVTQCHLMSPRRAMQPVSSTGPRGRQERGLPWNQPPDPNSQPGTGNVGKAALASDNPARCLAQREWEQQIRFSLGSFRPLELEAPQGRWLLRGFQGCSEGWDKERGISLRGLGRGWNIPERVGMKMEYPAAAPIPGLGNIHPIPGMLPMEFLLQAGMDPVPG